MILYNQLVNLLGISPHRRLTCRGVSPLHVNLNYENKPIAMQKHRVSDSPKSRRKSVAGKTFSGVSGKCSPLGGKRSIKTISEWLSGYVCLPRCF